jgi:predicted Zn-dependent peptidase
MNGNGYFRRELPAGARLVGETVPGRRSAAVGVWLAVGSRDEVHGAEGAAHFIEHMVFKGTRRRSGREIASSLERVGGSLEAFTTKEHTCFYARVLDEDLELAVDVLCDLVSRPLFGAEDVALERNVVLEELRNVEDTPEDLIGDLTHYHLWPGDIMGASILGTRESLGRLDADGIRDFHFREYRTPRVVVSAAGAVDADRLADLFARHLELPDEDPGARRRPPSPASATLAVYPYELSQVHLQLVAAAPSNRDPRRRAVQLLAEIFGGGMSSRLFQSIREEEGLAYSVQAYAEHFEDTGVLSTSLAVSPEKTDDALERTLEEMRVLARDGLRPGELEGAKAQVRGSLVMGMESLTHRMGHWARDAFRAGDHEPVEQTLAAYDAVTEEDVLAAAAESLDPARQNLVALGPLDSKQLEHTGFNRVPGLELE